MPKSRTRKRVFADTTIRTNEVRQSLIAIDAGVRAAPHAPIWQFGAKLSYDEIRMRLIGGAVF